MTFCVPENGTGHRITVESEMLIIGIHLSYICRSYGVDEYYVC